MRIRPGSTLEFLYPCNQHGTSKCMICGTTFQDHLNIWWERKLHKIQTLSDDEYQDPQRQQNRYQSFDEYVNRIYDRSIIFSTPIMETKKKRRGSKILKKDCSCYDCEDSQVKNKSQYKLYSDKIESHSFHSQYKVQEKIHHRSGKDNRTKNDDKREIAMGNNSQKSLSLNSRYLSNVVSNIIQLELYRLVLLESIDNYRVRKKRKRN